jgi:hypothetical protein
VNLVKRFTTETPLAMSVHSLNCYQLIYQLGKFGVSVTATKDLSMALEERFYLLGQHLRQLLSQPMVNRSIRLKRSST